jgi:UDP-N-acetylglucosamine--N-acetylmuramyl-(pentapeptide) pyrophosphoryl-undecaprenol N-acetylglucosamine transferase
LTTILYGVSPIGLGHATRAVAVGLKLKERGFDIEFATGGRATSFLASYGFKVNDIVTEPTPSEKNGVMRYPALWYLKYWRGYRSTKSRMIALIDRLNPDLIVGDEEFSSVSLAVERKIKNALISDELELGFARGSVSRYIEGKVSKWYSRLQKSVSHLLVPDFGSDHGNVHFMSPVVRQVTKSRKDLLHSLGIESESRIILLSASGSGIGKFLFNSVIGAMQDLHLPNVKLVVTGLSGLNPRQDMVALDVYRDNQNLVAAADLVISTAGKSTIDEAVSTGSPIIAIPIKNHSEQERNAASLGFVHEDLFRLPELFPRRIGMRTTPRNYLGAEMVATYLANML